MLLGKGYGMDISSFTGRASFQPDNALKLMTKYGT